LSDHERTVAFVGAVMAAITFTVGLGLTLDDFRRLAMRPRAVALGLAGQLLVLPALAFAAAAFFSLPAGLAVGLILIATCPGGAHSNLYTKLAKGDVALSVGLTATSNALGTLTVPFWLYLATIAHTSEARVIVVSPLQTVTQLALVLAIPLALGMMVRRASARWARRISPWLMGVAVSLLVLLIVGSVRANADEMLGFVAEAGAPVLALNVAAMLAAWGMGTVARLERSAAVAIIIEVGIQNATLAVGLAMSLSQDPAVLVPPIVYSLLVYFTGAAAVAYGRLGGHESPAEMSTAAS
jgi:bile acid:Na+ symporter, BASS family